MDEGRGEGELRFRSAQQLVAVVQDLVASTRSRHRIRFLLGKFWKEIEDHAHMASVSTDEGRVIPEI